MNAIDIHMRVDQDAIQRADLVGRVIWGMVREEASKKKERTLMQLAGLKPEHLAAVARNYAGFEGKTVNLAISKQISRELTLGLDPKFLTDRPGVFFRNSSAADVVLFAVSDEQRDLVGASLSNVTRIDRSSIQDKAGLWMELILEGAGDAIKGQEHRDWIEAMLRGLHEANIVMELDQFAEFVRLFMSLEAEQLENRLRLSAPALKLPKMPFPSVPLRGQDKAKLTGEFRNMFRNTHRDLADVPYLLDAKSTRMDVEPILKYLEDYPPQTADEKAAADAIRDLINDRRNLRHGEWRDSQRRFCETVLWHKYGASVFAFKARKQPPTLAKRTRDFIEAEYPQRLEESETKAYLQSLSEGTTTPEQDQEFFETWQDLIRTVKDKKLYESWRRHLFTDEVRSDDLGSLIVSGVRSLLIKNEEGFGADDLEIELKIKHGEKASTWAELNPRLVELLKLEGRLLEKTLAPYIRLEFGKWRSATGENRSRSALANQIEFEMKLFIAGEPAKSQVRLFWQPGFASIALAWPEDISGFMKAPRLIRVVSQPFELKQGGSVGGIPASLTDTASFIDVTGGSNGVTSNPVDYPEEANFFASVEQDLHDAERARRIDADSRNVLSVAVAEFREAFGKAITAIAKDSDDVYSGNLILNQARAFGDLCRIARERLGSRTTVRETLLKKIVEFGLVPAAGSQAVIIPAWHPLRLLERQGKARELREFLTLAIGSKTATVDGLERSSDVYVSVLREWFFPKLVSFDLSPFVTVEDCCGYSIAVPVDSTVSAEQKLEATAPVACREFMLATDKFIELNPHEEGNFSAALYNADAVSLAGLVAKELEQRMSKKAHLRAGLLITHDTSARMREVYAKQNARLGGENLDEITEGFLSRLRISVGSGESPPAGRRSAIDVVFLHDAFRKHAKMDWEIIDGAAEDLPEEIDFRNASLPRRRTDSTAAGDLATDAIEVFLTTSRPPRAAAQFMDLCYIAGKDTRTLEAGHRAIPIQRVRWDDEHVRKTIHKAHELGEWVVSVDTMSSRQMLSANGIKVIRDVQLPDIDMRVLVSARDPSQNLLRHLRSDFAAMQDPYINANARILSEQVVSTVVEVCGQKVLSSARSRSAAREIVGLAAATAIVNSEKAIAGKKPIWFSLDDNRAFFSHKGQLADTLAVTVAREEGRFVVSMTVVEAKCVNAASAAEEGKSSLQQVLSTLASINTNFVSQADMMARRAWGRQLLYLMSLRPEYIMFFADNDEVEEFRQAVADGTVEYRADGRSVVVIHDDVSVDKISVGAAGADDGVWQYTLKQGALSKVLKALVDSKGISDLPIPESVTPRVVPKSIMSDKLAAPAELALDIINSLTAEATSAQDDDGVVEAALDQAHLPQASEVTDTGGYLLNPAIPERLEKVLRRVAEAKGIDAQKETEAQFAEETSRNLQAALTELGMTAKFAEPKTISTPNGVLVNFAGHATLTVAKLNPKLLELRTTFGIDVIDIRTGLGRISLFVAAPQRRVVDLARVWLEAKWPTSAPGTLGNFLLGLREDTGEPLWLNLRGSHGANVEHGPHTLIAGETGSGKGVLTQNLLLQMIAFNSPDKLKIYMIDPKMGVDFPWLSDAPHMAQDIITDQEEAEHVLETIVHEMNRRYELIKTKKVPKIAEYNKLVPEAEQLPYIYLIHDEMADWMASSDEYRKVIQQQVTRLAAKGRACGIHVIMVTQRAAQEAIPPGIRDNLNNRLVLKVAGEAGSILALGLKGAQNLLDKGHLAARLNGDKPSGQDYFVAQVPFAATDDLAMYAEAAIEAWR